MKKISFLLCSFLASVTLFAEELTDGYEKVTDISSLTSSDKVILYCDGAEVGVSGFSGYKDANVSSDAADWIQYEVTPVSDGVLLYDPNAAQYIIQPGGNSFLYGTNNPMTCNISNGVFGGLDGTTQRYLCRNEDPTNGTFHRFYPNTNSTATTNKYPFYIYKVVEETPDIPIGKELTDGYEKVTDISSLQSNDKIVLYCDKAEVGVSGFSGYKDANVSSDASDWVQYEVTPVSGGVLL